MAGKTPNPLDAMTWEQKFIHAAFEFMKLQSRVAQLEEQIKRRDESAYQQAKRFELEQQCLRDLRDQLGERGCFDSEVLQSDVAKEARHLKQCCLTYRLIAMRLGITENQARYYCQGK